MKIQFNIKAKFTLMWDIGDVIIDFTKRYLKAYFGESNIEFIDRFTTQQCLPIKFKDNEVARIQDLIEIANGKMSDSVEILGETLDDALKAKALTKKPDELDYVKKAWADAKTENIKFGVNVLFD